MNGTLKKALRWIALPAMLVVLLTCSAFAAELSTVTVTENGTTPKAADIKMKFTFNPTETEEETMQDVYLAWGTDLDNPDKAISIVDEAGGTVEAVNAGNYVELTLTVKMDTINGNTVTVTEGKAAYGGEVAEEGFSPIKVRAAAMNTSYVDATSVSTADEWLNSYMMGNETCDITLTIFTFNGEGATIKIGETSYSCTFATGE